MFQNKSLFVLLFTIYAQFWLQTHQEKTLNCDSLVLWMLLSEVAAHMTPKTQNAQLGV